MGEVINFQNRRKNFMKGIQLTDANQMNDRVSYIGNRIREGTPEQEAKHKRLREAADYYYSLSPEARLEIQKKQMEQERARKRRKVKGARKKEEKYVGSRDKLTASLAAIAFAGVAFGTILAGIEANAIDKKPQYNVGLDGITQNQDLLQHLGISKETVAEIQSLQNMVDNGEINNLSDEELLKIGERIESVQLTTIKGKLANELGVSEDEIIVAPDYNDDAPKGVVKVTTPSGETRYNREGDLFDSQNNISGEISDYILNIANTQTANSRMEDGAYNRDEIISQYTSAINETSTIATKEMIKDENGNISLSQISEQEMDALIQNDGRIQKDDEER